MLPSIFTDHNRPARTSRFRASQAIEPMQNEGTVVYTPLILGFYDYLVLWLSNLLAWRCSTSRHLLPLFKEILGEKHLDIGVGTGYYPANSVGEGSRCREMTLLDLNSNSLKAARQRIATAAASSPSHPSLEINAIIADATESLPLEPSQKFDSISIFYLLHCIPGAASRKTRVFDAARKHLHTDGVLAGATILGSQRPMNWLAACLMALYNKKGIFDNWDDNDKVFSEGLRRNFEEVDVWTVGRVMLFTARKPRA